jgi:hypothetical protein
MQFIYWCLFTIGTEVCVLHSQLFLTPFPNCLRNRGHNQDTNWTFKCFQVWLKHERGNRQIDWKEPSSIAMSVVIIFAIAVSVLCDWKLANGLELGFRQERGDVELCLSNS